MIVWHLAAIIVLLSAVTSAPRVVIGDELTNAEDGCDPAPPRARSRGPPDEVARRRGSPAQGTCPIRYDPAHPPTTRAAQARPRAVPRTERLVVRHPTYTHRPHGGSQSSRTCTARLTVSDFKRNRWPESTGTSGRIRRNAQATTYTHESCRPA